jgi:peroxiredoxin Q/BCP
MVLEVGKEAPQFAVATEEGNEFKLSDWRGNSHVVLYFYPRDFTLGCTKEACDFRDNFDAIVAEGAVLIGVSTDTEERHRRFKAEHRLPFPLGADTDGRVTRLYDAERMFKIGGAQRVTYVIDKDGIIRAAFRHELAIGRHRGDVLLALRRINRDGASNSEE